MLLSGLRRERRPFGGGGGVVFEAGVGVSGGT
jgi:hypothetical protein